MRVLLDTHFLLWSLGSPSKLPAKARKIIQASNVFVSAASIWEIAIKSAIGKLKADPLEIAAAVGPAGFDFLPITAPHATRVAVLPSIHRDPFDRMLVAQALSEGMVLLTNDSMLRDYGPCVMISA